MSHADTQNFEQLPLDSSELSNKNRREKEIDPQLVDGSRSYDKVPAVNTGHSMKRTSQRGLIKLILLVNCAFTLTSFTNSIN